jgi:hypothetical protein
MYNQGIRKKESRKMVTICDKIGWGFKGRRKDGRVFIGVIKDVRIVKGERTLVVIRQKDDQFKSVHMDDIRGWSASLVNGQPWLLTE